MALISRWPCCKVTLFLQLSLTELYPISKHFISYFFIEVTIHSLHLFSSRMGWKVSSARSLSQQALILVILRLTVTRYRVISSIVLVAEHRPLGWLSWYNADVLFSSILWPYRMVVLGLCRC